MSARGPLVQVATKFGMLIGAIFVVTVLLAAMPGHHAPGTQAQEPQQPSSAAESQQEQQQSIDDKMPGMDIDDAKANEAHAVHDMTRGEHAHNAHMHMTAARPETPEDAARTKEIVDQLRAGIAKYKDYHVALAAGYKIFLPNLPQREYHFTNYMNGFLEAFTFDPARPTSLLYKKTSKGYELVGAMYTMPKRATEDQLNERVPLSVASWHLHTNLCMPPAKQRRNADWTKFGLRGSIATQEACDAAGGKFHPVIFGWMVHVYPYEDSTQKIFAMHHHD
ncbi:MAG TPA: hypothetical protein VE778_05945 [Candidatus Bathyarchaeia archaeon]|jgi:hypothetical protein|nr:hypothetical protein [Candidatus Bathyarchaeia archaeon]